ncbi:cobyric acid synthase [Komagataeibacter oboediens]|uniref:Cobyric acid synthase n=1 Tax=Komagataeibacter oboediens TaxID=65958 RepID=A0ABS5SNE4_9PROT|nr:cobyric acid synthase [Komagataeibacter oboediens]MBL7231983.1 cobyric acid synthase [Komagataeibacter oboediens]MBT0675385.1 cobyric acid synthase [Komagataeibacter oboediens]MBT0678922.1 cobyric acid synthase [Komagataeibacter oboediens]
MAARALMFQGTGSSVGKSVLVAGIARALTRRGLRVRPFKPQNMSNNAAVTADGGEIGRAQALQARACGAALSVDMNPVLLKPQGMTGSQLVVRGRMRGQVRAKDFQSFKRGLMPEVLDSFHALADQADIVLVEGAGSASEVNLRADDIANMGFAQAADVNVVLVGDIDRGGVIASLVGTQAVVADADARRIKGFIVNRMRGDPSLFDAGMAAIARMTGWRPVGLVPFLDRVRDLPAEDAADLHPGSQTGTQGLRIAVPCLPMIANFDDLDPLASEDGVCLTMVPRGQVLPPCDLVILPGAKATITDLAVLRDEGWDIDIHAHVRRGGHVLGICGGYQMLGRSIADPMGIEGAACTVDGLGLLDVATVLEGSKRLEEVTGRLLPEGVGLRGYEMHIGRTAGPDNDARPLTDLGGRYDGAVSPSGRVWGTYVHGLLADGGTRAAVLARLGARSHGHNHDATVDAALDALADHLETHLDIDSLLELARPVSRQREIDATLSR